MVGNALVLRYGLRATHRRVVSALWCLAFALAIGFVPGTLFAQSLAVGATQGGPGAVVFFDVTLTSGGHDLAAVQHELAFDPRTRIASRASGTPDCDINSEVSEFGELEGQSTFTPSGCTAATCTGIMIAVYPKGINLFSVPDGSRLYTCRVEIAANAPNGDYPLVATDVFSSDTDGKLVTTARTNGYVRVSSGCF